jgi:hypothetical protein
LLSSSKYHQLIDPDAQKTNTPDVESEEKLSHDNSSQNTAKPAKKLRKKKRLNKMKELKLGVSNEDDVYEEPVNLETYHLSHFAKADSKEEIEDSNSSNSQKEECANDYRIGPFSTG